MFFFWETLADIHGYKRNLSVNVLILIAKVQMRPEVKVQSYGFLQSKNISFVGLPGRLSYYLFSKILGNHKQTQLKSNCKSQRVSGFLI